MKYPVYAVLGVVLMLSGCERNISPNTYKASSVGEVQETLGGVILSAREVVVEHGENLEDNTMGMIGGGVLGGLAGNAFGKGSGRTLATAGGAVAGAVAGTFAEKELKRQTALEYTVKLDKGSLLTVVQGKDAPYAVGQRVYVIKSNQGRSRIVPAS
ncbi:MAG: hypothetical protein K0R63_484 [Rickettsiales bacterium]|nr:hypothetical protein [Rickettsiales bacterium]